MNKTLANRILIVLTYFILFSIIEGSLVKPNILNDRLRLASPRTNNNPCTDAFIAKHYKQLPWIHFRQCTNYLIKFPQTKLIKEQLVYLYLLFWSLYSSNPEEAKEVKKDIGLLLQACKEGCHLIMNRMQKLKDEAGKPLLRFL